MKILVVEDEKKMSNFIARGLKEEGYVVDTAPDGEVGWDYASSNEYDLYIFDWMLPKLNGIALCRKVREGGQKTPILMLTVKDAVEDKIKGLDEGADDYLTKPFHFDELLARVRALLRRPRDLKDEVILQSGNLKVDLLSRQTWIEEREIELSQKEFALLEYLLRRKGKVVSRSQIAEHVWDMNFDPMSNTIDVYINFIRKKIDEPDQKSRIETVRGVGYRING